MSAPNPISAFPIPLPIRAVMGAVLLASFLLFFVGLAIYNLLQRSAIIPSVIWLLLVVTVLFGFCKERGVGQVLVEMVGAFIRRQVIWTVQGNDGRNAVQFGYQILGRRFIYLSVPVEKIDSVSWGTGQASHFAGRDMNDWSVGLWYDHGDAEKARQRTWRKPEQEIYIVGQSGPKTEVAAFGHRLLDFLREAGVILVAGKDECSFERSKGMDKVS